MVDYRSFIKHSKPTPQAESQRKYEAGWDRVFNRYTQQDIDEIEKQVQELENLLGGDCETDT